MKNQVEKLYEIELKYMKEILQEGLDKGEFVFDEDSEFKAKLIITQLKGAISYVKLEDNFFQITDHVIKLVST